MGRIKRYAKKYKNSIKNSLIYKDYFQREILADQYFIESRNGKELAGNILRLILEIKKGSSKPPRIITAAAKGKEQDIRCMLDAYGLTEVKVDEYNSAEYFKDLSSSHYLINDVTFPNRYIKKEGQIYLNVWHGTPFKHMGRDNVSDCAKMDNMQRNFLMADYLLYPSAYCRDIMMKSYCLENLYRGKEVIGAYPRNAIFFEENISEIVKARYQLTGKKVYVYMPTYRESFVTEDGTNQADFLMKSFRQLDDLLDEDEVLIVKLHNLVQAQLNALSFDSFRHIQRFPKGVETYEFLTTATCLITDYSSVFYDFAVTGRKIIRFTYDEDTYFANRGFYAQPTPLPFPEVKKAEELIRELRSPKNYRDQDFLSCFCPHENQDAADHLIRLLHGDCPQELSITDHGLEPRGRRVFLFGGGLKTNGITSSLRNLYSAITDQDSEAARQYFIGFGRSAMGDGMNALSSMTGDCQLLEINDVMLPTFSEFLALILYQHFNLSSRRIRKKLDRLYTRECRRIFTGMPFTDYVHFTGYGINGIKLLQHAEGNRIIYVHNDMVQELKKKKGLQHGLTLKEAYTSYEHTALVSRSLIGPCKAITDGDDSKFAVVWNYQRDQDYRSRADLPIEIQEITDLVCSDPKPSADSIRSFLDQHPLKLVSVGRFSAEKNHALLLSTFENFHAAHPESGLIIIGGPGNQYQQTVSCVKNSPLKDHILLIRNIKNPMPVVKECDLFILTSHYEGMPMVFFEAAALGLPVLASRGKGVTEFMEDFGGYLVEANKEALLEGIETCLNSASGYLNIQFDVYNSKSIKGFLAMLK